MDSVAAWAVFGTFANFTMSCMLVGALAARPSRWLIERAVASWGLFVIVTIVAYTLNANRFGFPMDRELVRLFLVALVAVCVGIPAWWFGTLVFTWWKARRERLG